MKPSLAVMEEMISWPSLEGRATSTPESKAPSAFLVRGLPSGGCLREGVKIARCAAGNLAICRLGQGQESDFASQVDRTIPTFVDGYSR